MGVALNMTQETIRSQVDDIFAKLGVAGREEAVAEAAKLGLVGHR
ncbi:MAG: hypothetical protein ACREIC_17990 [Limisphaerales bacterium]